MGFLRNSYRDICAGRKQHARMLLEDGEYDRAAVGFRMLDMYQMAGDCFMKAGDVKAEEEDIEHAVDTYDRAVGCYEKAGQYKDMLRACEKAWCVKADHRCSISHMKQLIVNNQFEIFLENMRQHEPAKLAYCLETMKNWEGACNMYAFAAQQEGDHKEKYLVLDDAIECALKAGIDDYRLLKLHEDCFSANATDAKTEIDLSFYITRLQWIVESGNLRKFIDDLIGKFPVCLWHMLWEGNDHLGEDVIKKHREELAKYLLECVRKSESKSSPGKDWDEFMGTIGKQKLYYSYTAGRLSAAGFFIDAAEMFIVSDTQGSCDFYLKEAVECYKKANEPFKATDILEQLGKYKEAAGLAEKARNKKLAIRLYEQALKEKGIRDTEAEWIKITLQRLRKEKEKPSSNKSKPSKAAKPEDYM